MREQMEGAFAEVLESGQFILGPYVERFESQLAAFCGVEHVVGVSSGTDALLAAMMALGIGPGDEVIVPTFTFFATAGAVSRLGARPVFVDVSARTHNLDARMLEGAITRATKAIVPVHLFGLPADMAAIMKIARAHKLWVIEDAAQSLGARHDGRAVGSIGDIGCFSFYPTKGLSAMGDAGACVTNNAELADRLRMLRVHGSDRGYHFPMIGGNFRLDAVQAALLSVKMPHLDSWIRSRRRLANRYHHNFEDVPLSTPFEPDARFHAFNQYTVRLRGGQREALRHHLDACGIGNRVYYPLPLHLQPCFTELNYKRGMLPTAERAAGEVLSLPMYPEMTEQQQDEVIAAVRDFFAAE
ncbi:MAG: DegT/DnrJ/EryC1/StrS family aminotransferase [Phycisphaeraceae bacterium]